MTPDRKAILAHLQIVPLYLAWGDRIEFCRGEFALLRFDLDDASTLVAAGTLDDCLRAAGERGAL